MNELQTELQRIGLKLSESQFDQLNIGNAISLENVSLSEIGSAFIVGSTLFSLNLGKNKKTTFGDLLTTFLDGDACTGIPIYCWNSDLIYGKRYLCLTVVNGVPSFRICNKN